MISLIKFRKERLINIRKCFNNEEEIQNHVNLIQKENQSFQKKSKNARIKKLA